MTAAVPVNLYTVLKHLTGETIEIKLLTPEARGPIGDVRHVTIRY